MGSLGLLLGGPSAAQTAWEPSQHINLGPSSRILGNRLDKMFDPYGNTYAYGVGRFRYLPDSVWNVNYWDPAQNKTVFGPQTQKHNYSVTLGSGTDGDVWMPDDSVMFGGHQQFDSVPLNVYALPYGPANDGVVMSLNMTDRVFAGIRAGIAPDGPDGNGGIDNYPDFDAVTLFNFAYSAPPRFTASAAVKDQEGNTHAVRFDAGKAYFDKPLPPEWVRLLRKKMHVSTNIIGSNNADPNPHNRQPNNTWAGEITDWDPGGSWIAVSGWRVLDGHVGAGHVPGEAMGTPGSSDYVPANTYDTKKSSYTVPTLFVGVYTKAFNRNTMCMLTRDPPGDINNPKGTQDTQVQECEADEIDLQNSLPDYTGRAHGITITYNGPSKPTDDSYDLGLFGQNATMLRIWGGPNTTDIMGDAIWVHGDGGEQTGKTGTTQETAEFNSYADGTNDMRLATWNTRLRDRDYSNGTLGYTTQSLSLGYIVDGQRGHVPGDGSGQGGTIQSHIEFSPDGYQGGIGLCGYSKCQLFAQSNGDVTATNNLKAGAFIATRPGTDPRDPANFGAEYMTDSAGNVVLGSGTANAIIKATVPFDWVNVNNEVLASRLGVSSAGYDANSNTFAGQGSLYMWNVNSGDASTYLVNVGAGSAEGFKFYNVPTGGKLGNPLVTITSGGTVQAAGDLQAAGQVVSASNVVGTGIISKDSNGAPAATFSTDASDKGPSIGGAQGGNIHLTLPTLLQSNFTAIQGGSIGAGQALVFRQADWADGMEAPALGATGPTDFKFGTNTGQWASASAWDLTAQDKISAPTISSTGDVVAGRYVNLSPVAYADLGTTAVTGSMRYCTNCYSNNSTNKNPNIPVWWNGNAWTDALGDAVAVK